MNALMGFREMGFLEQVKILKEIEEEKKFEAIPELFELHEVPLNDKAVDSMVIHTLRGLLSKNEQMTLEGIQSGKVRVKKLCVNLAGENRFRSAGPLLLDLASKEKNGEMLLETLSSLSKIRAPEFLKVFQMNSNHPEPLISSLSIEMLGVYKDFTALDLLRGVIEEGESGGGYEKCNFVTWKAIEAVGSIGNGPALSFLASKIHHGNPTARRIIHEELVKKGREAIPCLVSIFDKEDVDCQILASNLLGAIGDKNGGEILLSIFDRKGEAIHPNVKYAIYEALGGIPFLKGTVCLMDGLLEEDDLLLMAVVFSLNRQINSAVINKLEEFVRPGNARSQRIMRAIAASKAMDLFKALYKKEEIAEKLLEIISGSNDPELISEFGAALEGIGGDRAKLDAERLSYVSAGKTGKKILAVDDSKAMLYFYRSAGSGLGLDVTTAINGREALDLLEKGEEFDLIVTDMNMPVMDGIEFILKFRENPAFKKIPVIMATTESEQSQIQLAEKAGANDFIQKPFTHDLFQKKAGKYISLTKSF